MRTRRAVLLLILLAGALVPTGAGAAPTGTGSLPAETGPLPAGSGSVLWVEGAAVVAGWTVPLAGPRAVGRPFQAPAHAYGAGHRGVDLVAVAGAQVLAAGPGVVAFAGAVAGRPVVSIDHPDGRRTTYEPVDPSVGAGQAVARGSPIGTLLAGHAGCPVEACLHWGVRRGEVYLDPLLLLRPPRIRLLPRG